MSAEKLLEDIRRHWEKVLHPPEDPYKYDNDLAAEFAGFAVFNWGDGFAYGKCHPYEILCHPGRFAQPGSKAEDQALVRQLGGRRVSVLLKLSAVLPYYLVKLLCREYNGDEPVERDASPENDLQKDVFARAVRFAESRGFKPIPEDDLEKLVPGALLELAAPGTVTVYNCLFEDQSN